MNIRDNNAHVCLVYEVWVVVWGVPHKCMVRVNILYYGSINRNIVVV